MARQEEILEERKQRDYMRAKVFYEKKMPVHLSLKNGTIFNGYITEVSNDFFFIDDVLQGNKSGRQLVFFIELMKPIEEFKERRD